MTPRTDYPVAALSVLLSADCLPERYHPLLVHKETLLTALPALGCRHKSDAEALTDEAFAAMGLDEAETRLLRRFFTLYDRKKKADADETLPEELYDLPGVSTVRASLYARSGYTTLARIAAAGPEEIRAATAETIAREGLCCIVPLPKEVRTHIAVARAFTWKE